MSESKNGGKNVAMFLVILALSAMTMMYLFWRFPVITAVVTLTVLALLGVSAKLARSIEASDMKGEHDPHGQGV